MTSLAATSSFKPENQWGYVSKLIHLRQVTLFSRFKRASPLIKAVDIGLALLIVGVAMGCYLLSNAILSELNSPLIVESGFDTVALLNSIPALVAAVVFLLSMMASFRVLLQALYLARDMDFLVAAPIPIRAVFLTKLLEAVLPNFILVLVFGLPVLLSLGAVGGFHNVYYPLVFIVLACIAFGAAGISSLLVMAVVRIFPAKRVAEVLTFLGAFLMITLSQAYNLVGNKLDTLSPEQVSARSQLFSSLNSPWLPLAWGGRSLVDMGQRNWLPGLFSLALTVGLSGIVFWLALSTAERLYYSGWASLQMGTQRKKNHRATERRYMNDTRTSILHRLLPPEVGRSW
jgi:ABC-2 type transport system permease protein